MQKFLRLMLLLALFAAPATMRAQCDNGAVQCNITFQMNDSYGDGWNGNTINVYQGTTLEVV